MPAPDPAAATTASGDTGSHRLADLDVHDDAVLTAYHRLHGRALGHDRPRFVPTSCAELAAILRTPSDRQERRTLGAFDGERLVGTALSVLPLRDNLDLAWLFVIVDPDLRRRGIGRALAVAGLAHAAGHRRHRVLSEFELDGAVSTEAATAYGPVAFARGLGFAIASREVRRELALPADPDRLAALDERARRAAAYRIETHTGLPDPSDLPDLVRLMGLVTVDAPTGSVTIEPEHFTADGVARLLTAKLAAGMHLLTVLARDGDGAVVGFSTQQASGEPAAPVIQTDTYVARLHRGHGLGAAMKAAGIRWWTQQQPARQRILTCNAQDNAAMVAINEAAGFVPIETLFLVARIAP
ncbi:MAG: GNAT family N-acetyltransferase [Actinobacteria bacterium]|nr:GNAT family N-acetyltransferase [Actinomycetota bacterium]